MKLLVLRYSNEDGSTLGLFLTNGKFTCYTLEDAFHIVKIPGETRIPEGTYKVELRKWGEHHEKYNNKFPEFHKGMLQIMDVPNYDDILIHIGNFVNDTEGCLLVGDTSINNINEPDVINNSTIAYKRMYPSIANAIESGEEVLITYKDIISYLD